MVKHTQTIRRQIADELFKCVWPFCEIGARRVKDELSRNLTTFSKCFGIFLKSQLFFVKFSAKNTVKSLIEILYSS